MVSTCKALEPAAKEIAQCFKGPDCANLDDEIEGLIRAQVTHALELLPNNKDWIPLFLGPKKSKRDEWLYIQNSPSYANPPNT